MTHQLPSESMTLKYFQDHIETVIEEVEKTGRLFYVQDETGREFMVRPLTTEEKEQYKGCKFNDDGTVEVELDIDDETFSQIDDAARAKGVSFNAYCVAAIRDYISKVDLYRNVLKASIRYMLEEGITRESLTDFGEAYKQVSEGLPLFHEHLDSIIQETFDEDEKAREEQYQRGIKATDSQ